MGADPPGRPMRSRLWPGATSNVARRAPPRHQSGCPAPGRTCRHGQSTPAKGCLAPTRAIGEADVASTRPLPGALPAGAPCHNVGTGRPLVRLDQRDFNALSPRRAPRGCPLRQCWDSTGGAAPLASLPTLSKTAPRRRRCRRSANRFGRLTPEVVFSQRSAASMSRRLRYEGHEGRPGGACQRARWRSIAGRSRSRTRPRGRARASARARAAPQALPPNASHLRLSRPREADRVKGYCAHLPPTLARDPTPQAGGRRPPTTSATPSATATYRFRDRVHPSRCSVSPSRGAIDLVIMATMTRANTRREGRRLAR